MATEGQTAVGPNGERAVFRNGQWEVVSAGGQASPQISVTSLPESPGARADRVRNEEAANRDETRTGIAVRGEGRDINRQQFDQINRLADAFNADPTVREYRVALQMLASALKTGEGAQSDLALTYAFAKAMDPGSVVREAEQGMVSGSQAIWDRVSEGVKKQFGMDGAGTFTPESRAAIRQQIINSVAQRAKAYTARRGFYAEQAQRFGFDPAAVVGPADGEPFVQDFAAYDKQVAGMRETGDKAGVGNTGLSGTTTDESPNVPQTPQPPEGSYQDSLMGQGISGVNEGIASTLGLPVDAATWAMNLVPRGLNAVANTDLPTIQDPFLGSDWFKQRMGDYGMTYAPSEDATNQFARRVGQSVGSAVVPVGMSANTGRAALAGLTSAISGGVGGAAAQQIAPGNVGAEFAGEMLGSLAGGGIGLLGARNAAQRQIEAGIPTVPQLKDQATQLYQRAEQNGVTASPQQTQQLADDMMGVLRQEGRVSPTGRISETYPKALEGMQLASDYAGQPMTPTQMQTVRSVISDGLSSTEPAERRISGLLVDQFDNWANPMAPELPQARDVASRYLAAQQLERARELAEANTSAFTGSGLENALRSQYRQLDRNMIRGSARFNDDVAGAIETVNRGTDLSNVARGLGKLAPTGVVSAGLGMGIPGMLGTAIGGPGLGIAAGLGAGLTGQAGRAAATRMTERAADVAELTARNGGAIPLAPAITPETARVISAVMASELGQKAVGPQRQNNEGSGNTPDGLARRVRRASPSPRGMFGRAP